MNKDKIKQDKINEVEINNFIKYYEKYCTYPTLTDNPIEARMFFRDFLLAFLKNRKSIKIVGADKMRGFEINISGSDMELETFKRLVKTCKDIWEHPEDYYKYENDSYYDFLKYLWVIKNDDDENAKLLSDYATMKDEDYNNTIEFLKKYKSQ